MAVWEDQEEDELAITPPADAEDNRPSHRSSQSSLGGGGGGIQVSMWVKNYEREEFNPASLVPPLEWLPAYARSVAGRGREADLAIVGPLRYSLRGDLLAGLCVGLILVPQSMSFALVAGLPVRAGLYASFGPLIVYAALGTIRQVQPGPTALMSLITGQALDAMGFLEEQERMQSAALLALAAGGLCVLFGAIRFGAIENFVSHSVMAAFCSAAGVMIATSQLYHLLGIDEARSQFWWETVAHIAVHLREADPYTVALGGTLLALVLTLKAWKTAGGLDRRAKHWLWRWFPKEKKLLRFRIFWCLADMSSLLSVLLGWLWGVVYREVGVTSVKFVSDADSVGFHFILPLRTIDRWQLDSFLLSATVLAVVGFLETAAVGGRLALQTRLTYNKNQELLALGCANMAGAVMAGCATSGCYFRSNVNAALGATSLLACVVSSLVVVLAVVAVLPRFLAVLPLASLAPIAIQGSIGVINVHDFLVAFRTSRTEFVVMLATFLVSLGHSARVGLLVGIVLSLLNTMIDLANPNLVVCGRLSDGSFRDVRNFPQAEQLPNTVVVRMDARLSFANARKMKEFCQRAVNVREKGGDNIEFVVIDGKSINHVDLTGCEMLEKLAENLGANSQRLVIANVKGCVVGCLFQAGVPSTLQRYNGCLCSDMEQAIEIVDGGDPVRASVYVKELKELMQKVESAKRVLSRSNTR